MTLEHAIISFGGRSWRVDLHKDPGSCFGVVFPDVAGCFSAGDTRREALANAVDALRLHLAALTRNRAQR